MQNSHNIDHSSRDVSTVWCSLIGRSGLNLKLTYAYLLNYASGFLSSAGPMDFRVPPASVSSSPATLASLLSYTDASKVSAPSAALRTTIASTQPVTPVKPPATSSAPAVALFKNSTPTTLRQVCVNYFTLKH